LGTSGLMSGEGKPPAASRSRSSALPRLYIAHSTLLFEASTVGDSILMLNDDFSAEFGLEPLAEGKSPLYIHHYSADADAAWKQAGCEVTMPMSDQFWGDRYGHVRDPFGFNWAIASRKEELTPGEIEERAAKAFAQGHP